MKSLSLYKETGFTSLQKVKARIDCIILRNTSVPFTGIKLQVCTREHPKCQSTKQVLLSRPLTIYIVFLDFQPDARDKGQGVSRTLSFLCWKQVWSCFSLLGLLLWPAEAAEAASSGPMYGPSHTSILLSLLIVWLTDVYPQSSKVIFCHLLAFMLLISSAFGSNLQIFLCQLFRFSYFYLYFET